MKIHDFIRLHLKAQHRGTGTTIYFPMIHILIEESPEGYLATCLEYSQSFEAGKPDSAVVGLINFMYRYFFSVLKSEGKDAIYAQARSPENNHLWDEIREYSARKHDQDLDFVAESFEAAGDLESIRSELQQRKTPDEHMRVQDHINVVNEKDRIIQQQKELIEAIIERYMEQLQEQGLQRLGIEGADEWIRAMSREDIDVASKSSHGF